ncbi:melanoma-associated antigen 10-like [Echinops telfairi]|uniref:Melanoma-associated antigen 10-like n=1 Tax=Echinops telfairi TaxID=9371 RepID=A0ABM0J2L5_ECHTE|nr:melanoma-associated antigen 10-like [Echinops telfairi]
MTLSTSDENSRDSEDEGSPSTSASTQSLNLAPPKEEELSPPQSSETVFSIMTLSTSDENSRDSEDEGSPSTSASIQSLPRDPPEEEVTGIVRFLLLKYQMGQLTAKLEMLDVVSSDFKNQFPVVFQRASQSLKMVFGIDLKEVDSILGTYALENSLGLTYNRVLIDDEVMPQNGILILILGVILLEGNSASEEVIWEFLNKMSVHAGKEGVLDGKRRELITKDWVQDQYLKYCQVPESDPVRYEFLWGPRAHAETNRMNVLEFFAMVNGNDLSSYPPWYEEALREVGERAQARIASTDTATIPVPAVSPAPK